MVDDLIETAIEVDERAGRPQPAGQFFAGDQFAGLFEQCQQQLQRSGRGAASVGRRARTRRYARPE